MDEASRLKALERYAILDTPSEQGFDDIVLLASQICETPVALVSFVASDRQWFKARVGFDRCQTPLSQSVCALAIRQPGLFVIPDLSVDDRTRENTLVSNAPNIRFYAGARLETPEGQALGSLCVIDTEPRPEGLRPDQAAALEALSRQAMALWELRIVQREQGAELSRTQSVLRQSQKMEALGQLTGGIAHDFNNLLTGIIGSVDIIRRRIEATRLEDVPRFLDNASTAAHHAAALTNRLLAFARQQPPDTKSTDVTKLIASMDDLLRRTLGKGMGLEVVLADNLWPAMLDPNQLENAILNLAINARDAMPEGGKLTVETSNVHLDEAYVQQRDNLTAGDYVSVSVTDTGTGMSPDIIAKVFEPFFTTKPEGAGTGLGLSMVYGFIKQSHGHVRIHSKVGIGTTIHLYLPRALADLDEDPVEENVATPRGEGEIILVVEDDDRVRLLIITVLEELNYRYIEASNAVSGLALLQSRADVDLLITDMGLPGTTGRQLVDIARRSHPDLRVLFVTGYAEVAAARADLLGAGTDFLAKPFSLDSLGSKVREIIGRR
jgi:signal transduction histidine kinase/CheY-like chemotaxis protein